MSQDLRELMDGIRDQMTQFHEKLESRAQEIELTGGDHDVAKKLTMGADAMKDSGNIYVSWARHYVALSEGGAAEAEEGEAVFRPPAHPRTRVDFLSGLKVRPSAESLEGPLFRAFRRIRRRTVVEIPAVPVRAPFPDVADHVAALLVRNVGRQASHRHR